MSYELYVEPGLKDFTLEAVAGNDIGAEFFVYIDGFVYPKFETGSGWRVVPMTGYDLKGPVTALGMGFLTRGGVCILYVVFGDERI